MSRNYIGYEATGDADDPRRRLRARSGSAAGGADAGAVLAATTRATRARDAGDLPLDAATSAISATAAQELTWQLAGLDDLDTENPVVRAALRDELRLLDPRGRRRCIPRRHRVLRAARLLRAISCTRDDPEAPGMRRGGAARPGATISSCSAKASALDKPFEDAQARADRRVHAQAPTARRCCPA